MSKVLFVNDTVSVGGVELKLHEFESLVELHLKSVAVTRELEQDGKLLVANGFELPQLEDFIRRVCRWGDYTGIAGRVLRRNVRIPGHTDH